MQANDGDSDSEHFPDTQGRPEGESRRAGLPPVYNNATVHDKFHELNHTKTEALRDISEGGFSWFHLKLGFVASAGFFADAYDMFTINLASIMLGYVYGHTPGPGLTRRLSSNQDFGIRVAAPVGNLFGRLLSGWLADIVGRRRMYRIELMVIAASTFAQVLSRSGSGVNIIGVLIVWRFIMGIGVGMGGDHSLSTVIASEFASTSNRSRLVSTVFTAQGWGNFAASLVELATIHAYKDSILADNLSELKHVDYCWRTLIGLGSVPGAIALYLKLTVPETPRFRMDIDRDVQRARADVERVLGRSGTSAAVYWFDPDAVARHEESPRRGRSDFTSYFARRDDFLLLFGVAYSWFAIDVAFYGFAGLKSSSILTSALLARARIDSTPSNLNTALGIYQSLHDIVIGSLVVSVAGLLLGYYASFLLIDVWGRRPIQFLGFVMLTSLLAVLAGIYLDPRPH